MWILVPFFRSKWDLSQKQDNGKKKKKAQPTIRGGSDNFQRKRGNRQPKTAQQRQQRQRNKTKEEHTK